MQGITGVCQLLKSCHVFNGLFFSLTLMLSDTFLHVLTGTEKCIVNAYLLNGLMDVNPLRSQVTDSHACALSDWCLTHINAQIYAHTIPTYLLMFVVWLPMLFLCRLKPPLMAGLNRRPLLIGQPLSNYFSLYLLSQLELCRIPNTSMLNRSLRARPKQHTDPAFTPRRANVSGLVRPSARHGESAG